MIEREKLLNMLQPLLEPVREGVIITDQSGLVLACNKSVQRLFGMPPEATIGGLNNIGGHNLRAILIRQGISEEDEHDLHHCELTLEFDIELRVHSEPRWLRINSTLVTLPCEDGKVRMIVLRDVTAEKRLFAAMANKDSCGIATRDPDMLRIVDRLNLVANSDAAVLIQGESGTGKTTLARMVHDNSRRADAAFVEVNCGAIPASLIESELFGHVKGAFTGAIKDRPGRFKAADGGTLFLDEISELPKELQPKLLRVLQDGEYEPVGADTTVKVDVRLVTASNQNLPEMVDGGSFRPDLFYRIAVVALLVPPLRERPGDIPVLLDALLKRLALRGYPAGVRFSQDAMRALMNYPWPGNVRELANAIEHGLICAVDGVVGALSLPDTLRAYCDARSRPLNGLETIDTGERERIDAALRQSNGNKTLAAQILGIDRSTLWRRMQKLGMI